MKRIDIETITSAMVEKQTWVRKELKDFLKVWAEVTEDPISGHEKFILYEFGPERGITKRLFLYRGSNEVDGDNLIVHEWINWDSYLNIDTQHIDRIRHIIQVICDGLPQYFKDIQEDIGSLDKLGNNLSEMACLLNFKAMQADIGSLDKSVMKISAILKNLS